MELILIVLLTVVLLLWFLTLFPAVPANFGWATAWFAWIAAVLLTLLLVVGGHVALR